MKQLYCVSCGHEFPAEGARMKPELVGMALFVTIGVVMILGGIVGLIVFLPGWRDSQALQPIIYCALAIVFGLGPLSFGLKCRKGTKAICPACGRPQGIPSDSRIAEEVRRRKSGK
jgi:hypothetical protein